jgi:hypothetical protein
MRGWRRCRTWPAASRAASAVTYAIRTYERIAVPVAEEPTAAELQKVAAALRDVPDRADERVYRHYLEAAVRALATGGG